MTSLEQNIQKIKSQMYALLGTPVQSQAKDIPASLARAIDYTCLTPQATHDDIVQLCHEAKQHRFRTVCVAPTWVETAATTLRNHPIDVCTVVGFPLGSATTASKVFETKTAIEQGATEIDMVLHQGWLAQGDFKNVFEDIRAVVHAAKGHVVKVIIETAHVSSPQLIQACFIAQCAGAHFVKTSTGFAHKGANTEDIQCMHACVGSTMGIKASGGISTRAQAQAMLQAGATRIGASKANQWMDA